MTLSIVILAAGQGKRMHSELPKVLHRLAGKPLLEHIITTAWELHPTAPPLVIYGHQGETVKKALDYLNARWVLQAEQLGTGHAVLQTLAHIPEDHRVLILYGDVPLISAETLRHLLQTTPHHAVGIITATVAHPAGLGRIIRDTQKQIVQVVEEKDADAIQKKIQEINSGLYVIPAQYLKKWLPKLSNHNAQKEFYLPEVIQFAVQENIPIHSIEPTTHEEIFGINDRAQLAHLERFYQRHAAEKLMRQGVTFFDPSRFDLRGELVAGQDTTIDVNVIIEGQVTLGNHCIIGPHVILRNTTIGSHTEIKAHSIIDGAEIAEHCVIGPFARIRPGTILANTVHIGNFVEIKNSVVDSASKINHLSYVGDSSIGKQVNIGAGTITCNYDGMNKHRTIIEDRAFIGSSTQLVAPVTVGESATIGAGSTITQNAPPHKLTLARAKQITIDHWKRQTVQEK